MNVELQFRDAAAARAIVLPEHLIADGRLQRCDTEGKNGKGDATYKLHLDGIPAGGFQNWQDGLGWENWKADTGREYTAEERAEYAKRMETARKESAELKAACHAEAKGKAKAILDKAVSGPHDYLVRKQVKAHGTKVYKGCIVVPVRNTDGVLHSLQFISPDGTKRFLKGGEVQGCYFSIGKPGDALCIAEGFATGASIHQATGYAVAVAFDAGKLEAVARALRAKLPNIRMIVCGDDDYLQVCRHCEQKTPVEIKLCTHCGEPHGKVNTGVIKANAAARAVGGEVAFPKFNGERGTDFNDLHVAEGLESVRACIEAATTPQDAPETASTGVRAGRYVELIRADTIDPEAVLWLWNGYVVAGKINILAGPPGIGKTTLAMSVVAALTTGGRWPDGTVAETGRVMIWSGEDTPGDVLVPRLMACGADRNKVDFVKGVRDGSKSHDFNPATDLDVLRQAMLGKDYKLLIVDSIVSAVSGDSYKNAEVRKSLEPLGALAAETGCAILGIAHFSKGSAGKEPLDRVLGSIAFGAYPRLVLASVKRAEEHGGGCIVTRAKSNHGPDGGGFAYSVEQVELVNRPDISASRIVWKEALEGTARQILADAEQQQDDSNGGSLADAVEWLRQVLTDEGGSLEQKNVMLAAKNAGLNDTAIQRARKKLGVEAKRTGFGANLSSTWTLPKAAPFVSKPPFVPFISPKNNETNDTNGPVGVAETEWVEL